MTSKKLIASCALAALLALAGCGGGGEETAEASLTKAEFRNKANLICNDAGNEQFEEANKYFKKHPGAEEADVADQAIPPLEKALQELKDLPEPQGFEAQLETFYAEFEKALDQAREDPSILLSEEHNPFEEANRLGEKYQLGDCALSP
jgi:hypothetical protein